MRTHRRWLSREFATFTLAIAMAGAAATVAAAKTAGECKSDYDSRVRACYSNPDTSHMDTPTEVRYCLQRAQNRFDSCLTSLVDAISGGSLELSSGDPPKRPPLRPEFNAMPGLLEQSRGDGMQPQGPAGAGTPSRAPSFR